MTTYKRMRRTCLGCGCSTDYWGVTSSNNFGGEFASDFGPGATKNACGCGSTDFTRTCLDTFDPALYTPVAYLDLSDHILEALRQDKIQWIGDLVTKTEQEILSYPGLDKDHLAEINNELSRVGVTLGSDLPGWPPFPVK